MIKSSIGEQPEGLRSRLESEAHVWLCELEPWRDFPLLIGEEKDRARTLRHPDAQTSFIAGRSLLRFVLSHYSELEPSDWSFTSSRVGRPEITGPEPVATLRFNLTHTRGLAALVVTRTADCGIDVEQLDRPLKPLRIAEHSFAPEEFRDLEAQAPAALKERFFSYWTLKESYYKATGSGIPFRMTGARFDLTGETRIAFEPSEDEGARASDWQFGLHRPTDEHVLAIALASGPERHLDLRSFSSLGSEGGATFTASSLPSIRATTPAQKAGA